MRSAFLVCALAVVALLAVGSNAAYICGDSAPDLFKLTNCTTCLSTMCTCIGGTYTAASATCTQPNPATVTCAERVTCLTTFKTCVIETAEKAANSSSTVECDSWGAPLQTQLLAYLVNGVNSSAYTTLQSACEQMVCSIYNDSFQETCTDPSSTLCENFTSSSSIVSTLVAVIVAIVAAVLTL